MDDCTFWYTTEYLKANGTFNWNTRVASFKFPSCSGGSPTPDFSLSPNPTSQTITQGSTANYTITVSSLNTFSGTVNLSMGSGCPTNATCSVTPSVSVSSGGSANATLSVTNTGTTPAGTYSSISVNADDGGSLSHSTSVSLTVNLPASPDFAISASPGNLTLRRGTAGSYNVTITPSGGFTGAVSITATCPTNVTCGSPGVTITSGAASAPLLVAVGTNATRGNYTVSITGSGGGKSHSTSVGLKVR